MFGLDHAPSGPAAGAGAPVSLADQTDAATATRPPGARPIGRPESVTVAAVAEAAEERALLRGDRCFSAWDGSHTGLVRVLRDNLRNPSSFQHVSTARTKSAVPGTVTIIMTYRAQNGFGGMNIERIKATFEPRSCMVLDLAEMRG